MDFILNILNTDSNVSHEKKNIDVEMILVSILYRIVGISYSYRIFIERHLTEYIFY